MGAGNIHPIGCALFAVRIGLHFSLDPQVFLAKSVAKRCIGDQFRERFPRGVVAGDFNPSNGRSVFNDIEPLLHKSHGIGKSKGVGDQY